MLFSRGRIVHAHALVVVGGGSSGGRRWERHGFGQGLVNVTLIDFDHLLDEGRNVLDVCQGGLHAHVGLSLHAEGGRVESSGGELGLVRNVLLKQFLVARRGERLAVGPEVWADNDTQVLLGESLGEIVDIARRRCWRSCG